MLEVRNVYKSFEVSGTEHMVLDDLSFTVQDRDFYIILGQSGCGKSTLLRMIGGFNKPGKGEILLDGRAVSGPSKDMMMVFQSFDQLFPWFTLKGNLVYALKKAGILPEGNDYGQCAVRYLTMAGLEEVSGQLSPSAFRRYEAEGGAGQGTLLKAQAAADGRTVFQPGLYDKTGII